MGIKEATRRVALSALAVVCLTGWGVPERVECLADDQQLPIYRIQIDYLMGSGHASAVIVAPGYALTASHAVDGQPKAISVLTPEGPRAATRIASDPVNDMALLTLDTTGLDVLPFSQRDLKPGETVWTVGFAGTAGSSYKGNILEVIGGHARISAPVFPGMSGGAVVSCEDGNPRMSGTITSFNYRVTRTWRTIVPGKESTFERVINDGTSNAPIGMMPVWFTEYAIEMYEDNKKRE